MEKDENTLLLIKISSDIASVKQHLSDMNGRLIRHEKQLDKCPETHKNLDVVLDKMRDEITKIKTKTGIYIGIASGVGGALIVGVLNVLILKHLGG